MELVEPSAHYKDSFIDAVKEYRTSNEDSDRSDRHAQLSIDELDQNFDAFVEIVRGHAKGEGLPDGYVPESEYWLVDSETYVGRVHIRHQLTNHLRQLGGHIGYDIRPSMRGHGFGNTILALALPYAKALGISPVLVTCDVTNVPSRKVIEKNGGTLENQVQNPATGVDKLRYWIHP